MTFRIARRLLGGALTLLVVLLALAMLVPTLLGYHRYVIMTGSMTGTYDPGSIVYDKAVPVDALRAGDVITYAPPAGSTSSSLVTHRIVSIQRDAHGSRVFRTKGDANRSADPWRFSLASPTQARVAFSIPYAGRVVMALSDRHTRMLVIGLPALIVALLALLRTFGEARAGRRTAPAAHSPAGTNL